MEDRKRIEEDGIASPRLEMLTKWIAVYGWQLRKESKRKERITNLKRTGIPRGGLPPLSGTNEEIMRQLERQINEGKRNLK